MYDIIHKVHIKAPAEKVYESIATVEGLKGWWTEHVDGDSQENEKLTFRFPETGPVMEVLELSPNDFIKWKCVEGVEGWTDTILTFELEEKDGGTEVFFAQSGWQDQSAFYAHCNTKWGVFMLSLKSVCEEDQGRPFPQDIAID